MNGTMKLCKKKDKIKIKIIKFNNKAEFKNRNQMTYGKQFSNLFEKNFFNFYRFINKKKGRCKVLSLVE